MEQLWLFPINNITTIRREVLNTLRKIPGETKEEYNELVRIEVDYRMSQLIYKHPKYTDFDIYTIQELKSVKNIFFKKGRTDGF